MAFSKDSRRAKIRTRIRARVKGTDVKPRLSVFRSNKQIYAQIIDDNQGVTLASASSNVMKEAQNIAKIEQARIIGKTIAERAKAAGIEEVVLPMIRACSILAMFCASFITLDEADARVTPWLSSMI